MKSFKLLVVGMLVAMMVLSLAGCGGASADPAAVDETAPAAPAEAETVVQAVTEQIADSVDTGTKVDKIVGEWVDVNAPDRFAKITVDGTAYTYEDNEGKYPGTFENGVLKLKVSETDTADVYIDTATGHLMMVYLDNISEFSPKQ